MLLRMLTALAIVGAGVSAASADDFDDVRDEWRDYQRELRRGDFDDAAEEWHEYQRARSRLYWRGARYRSGYHYGYGPRYVPRSGFYYYPGGYGWYYRRW